MNNRLIKSNDAGGGGCTNTVDLYNPFPDGGGVALYQLNGELLTRVGTMMVLLQMLLMVRVNLDKQGFLMALHLK